MFAVRARRNFAFAGVVENNLRAEDVVCDFLEGLTKGRQRLQLVSLTRADARGLPDSAIVASYRYTLHGLSYVVNGSNKTWEPDHLLTSTLAGSRQRIEFAAMENGHVFIWAGHLDLGAVSDAAGETAELDDVPRCDTPHGPVPVTALKNGDFVATRDCGFQEIRSIHRQPVVCDQHSAPIMLRFDRAGASPQVLLSQHQRMIVMGELCLKAFGEFELVVSAQQLMRAGLAISAVPGAYDLFCIMFDSHQFVSVDGVWFECFHPSDTSLRAQSSATREELLDHFPECHDARMAGPRRLARRALQDIETPELFRRVRLGSLHNADKPHFVLCND